MTAKTTEQSKFPRPTEGVGNFVRFFAVPKGSQIVHFSGFGSREDTGVPINGRIENTPESIAYGKKAAKGAARNLLGNIEEMLEKLNLTKRDIHHINMTVHINASNEVKSLPIIADAACEELDRFFGAGFCRRSITRAALGNNTLPGDMTVEIIATVYLHSARAVPRTEDRTGPQIVSRL